MTPQIAGLVRVFRGNPDGFTSRQLTGDVLRQQNLVLTMTRRHRSRVLELEPSLLRRTFTIREFARMVNALTSRILPGEGLPISPSARWERMLLLALRLRSEVAARQEDDEVVDPFRRDDDLHNMMVRQLIPALETLSEFERGGLVEPPG